MVFQVVVSIIVLVMPGALQMQSNDSNHSKYNGHVTLATHSGGYIVSFLSKMVILSFGIPCARKKR